MQEQNFVVSGVFRTNRYRAAHLAVLGSLYGSENITYKRIPEFHQSLRRQYRAWLQSTFNDGAQGIRSPAELLVMKNCPPFGVVTDTHSFVGDDGRRHKIRPCKRHIFCPYCFARSVTVRAYAAVEGILFTDDDTTSLWLTESTTHHTYDMSAILAMEKVVARIKDKENRRRDFDRVADLGGVTVFTVDLRPQGVHLTKGCLIVTQPGVRVYPDGNARRKDEDVGIYAFNKTFSGVTKGVLSSCVARVAAYSRHHLATVNAEWFDLALRDLHGVRMLSTYGMARQIKEEEEK